MHEDRRSRRHLAAVLVVLGLAACNGPFATFPGGALEGPVSPAPGRFDAAVNGRIIELETRPEDPYSVNVAACIVDGRLYVSAGDNHSAWAAHMDADPRVRVRIDGRIHELAASRVTARDELQAFADVWTKNAWARDPMGLAEVWVYRLAVR